MAHLKLRSDSFNQWFEDWLKQHFPLADRLIRYLMGQLKPIEDPKSRQAADFFIYFLIAVSVMMFILLMGVEKGDWGRLAGQIWTNSRLSVHLRQIIT